MGPSILWVTRFFPPNFDNQQEYIPRMGYFAIAMKEMIMVGDHTVIGHFLLGELKNDQDEICGSDQHTNIWNVGDEIHMIKVSPNQELLFVRLTVRGV
jgi:hypothetical protein